MKVFTGLLLLGCLAAVHCRGAHGGNFAQIFEMGNEPSWVGEFISEEEHSPEDLPEPPILPPHIRPPPVDFDKVSVVRPIMPDRRRLNDRSGIQNLLVPIKDAPEPKPIL